MMGLFNMGFIIDFISLPVITGFTTSAALTIAWGQVHCAQCTCTIHALHFNSKSVKTQRDISESWFSSMWFCEAFSMITKRESVETLDYGVFAHSHTDTVPACLREWQQATHEHAIGGLTMEVPCANRSTR